MKILFLILCSLFNVVLYAQADKDSIRLLVRLTVDSETITVMRSLALYELMEIEKAGFLKDYDSLANEFYNNLGLYYTKEYSKEDIECLLSFYKSSVGQKVSEDLKNLYKDNLPGHKPLSELLKILRAQCKGDTIQSQPLQDLGVADENLKFYLEILGVWEYLNFVKDYEAIWIEPQDEESLKKAFDKLVVEYPKELARYYASKYTEADKKQILIFYHSSLGKKVVANAGVFAAVNRNAYQKWIAGYMALKSDLTFGKYQRD